MNLKEFNLFLFPLIASLNFICVYVCMFSKFLKKKYYYQVTDFFSISNSND